MTPSAATLPAPSPWATDDGTPLGDFAAADLGLLEEAATAPDDELAPDDASTPRVEEGQVPDASADADARPEAPEAEQQALLAFLAQYGQYVALFVGAGLIAGSVVHFPLAPVRYGVLGAIGGGLFAAASVVAERDRHTPAGLARVAGAALALALGIGMVSGSIQHFGDIPQRAAILIPAGLVLSLGAFLVRHGKRLHKEDLTAAAMWSAVVMVVLFEGLGRVADGMTPAAGGHGAAGHHAAPAAAPKPAAAPAAPGKDAAHGKEAAPAKPAADAHAEAPHGH